MIVIDIPAHMECVEEGCGATEPVRLCITALGTLAFQAPKDALNDWQALTNGGAITCRCPKHKMELPEPPRIQVGPAGPRIMRPHNAH